jgi:hypothetical protein
MQISTRSIMAIVNPKLACFLSPCLSGTSGENEPEQNGNLTVLSEIQRQSWFRHCQKKPA